MLSIIQNQIIFYIALAFVMFLPGWFLFLATFGKNKTISDLERFIFSFGLSIVSVDFILFTYSGLHIPLTRLSVVSGILLFSVICILIYKFRSTTEVGPLSQDRGPTSVEDDDLFNFSRNQFILVLMLLFLTVFIKTAYLSGSMAPTPTDLGHHLYWSKLMTQTHQLTNYESLPDFIIGEHTMFLSIDLITGSSFFSGWPVVVLYLVNLLGILTVFVLTLRIFKGKTVAILSILFLGVLFAVSAPQAKYVSGGVMGNIFGNFLMPLAFYFYYRSLESLQDKKEILRFAQDDKNSSTFLCLAVFITFGLFYTHHLTSFIFLFVFTLTILLFLILNYKDIKPLVQKVVKTIFTPSVLGVFIVGIIFFFFIFTPTYVNTKAVDTAVGTATKSTRVGLSLDNLRDTVGESRMALGFLGFVILLSSFRRKNFGFSLIAAWAFMIFLMSTSPNLLFVDLPSNRIGNYLTYPMAILSAYALYAVFHPQFFGSIFKLQSFNDSPFLIHNIIKGTFLILLTFVLVTGISDSALAFKKQDNLTETSQTFKSAQYLAKNTTSDDIILKDHNYITADSWMKMFFMRGYKYPASRGLFSRYETTGNRSNDLCTLIMISNPGSSDAQKCFSDTKTDFLMINPRYDLPQFQKLSDFNQIYMSPEVAIYFRKEL